MLMSQRICNPTFDPQSIQLLASEMDSLDLKLLDESALRSIRLLKVGPSLPLHHFLSLQARIILFFCGF